MLKILGRETSINVRKVLWALDEVEIGYEREDWGMPLRDPKVPEFLVLNPNGQIPVLIEDGFVLWESNAILVYLSETKVGVLAVEDARMRALSYQWLGWQAAELNPQWSYAVRALIRHEPGLDDANKVASSVMRWTKKMDVLEEHLEQGGSYVAGDRFTIADIAIGLSMHRWFCLPYTRKAMPAISRYYERLKGRPAGAKWMTDALT